MRVNSFDDFARQIPSVDLAAVVDPVARIVELHGCGNVCVRWDERLPLVHLVCALYSGVTADTAGAVEELVAGWNHQLPLPGLGVDRDSGVIYFRWVLARDAEGLAFEHFVSVLSLILDEVAGLRPVLEEALRPRVALEPHILRELGDHFAA
jgi:hypothetical protein